MKEPSARNYMRERRINKLVQSLSSPHSTLQMRPPLADQEANVMMGARQELNAAEIGRPELHELNEYQSAHNCELNDDQSVHNSPQNIDHAMYDNPNYDIDDGMVTIDEQEQYEQISFAADNVHLEFNDTFTAADDTPVFEGGHVSIDMAMTAILKFVVTASLSNSNISSLLSTLQFILTGHKNSLPKSLYKFQQYYRDIDVMKKVFYCKEHRTLSSGACRYCGQKEEFICWNGITRALKKRLKTKRFYENVRGCVCMGQYICMKIELIYHSVNIIEHNMLKQVQDQMMYMKAKSIKLLEHLSPARKMDTLFCSIGMV